MKKVTSLVLILAAVAVCPVWAETARPPHSVSIGLGGVFPYSELDTGGLEAGDQRVGSNSGILGARYMYASNPRIDIGVGLETWKTGEEEFDIASIFVGEMDMKSTTFMALAKIHPASSNAFVPYFLGGLGVHFSEFNFEITPVPPVTWLEGNPTESRSLISDKKSGLAATLGVGVDFNVSKNFFMALEGRLDMLSEEEYESTAFGQEFEIAHADTGATNGVLQLRLGFRFGGSDAVAPDAANPPKEVPTKPEGAI